MRIYFDLNYEDMLTSAMKAGKCPFVTLVRQDYMSTPSELYTDVEIIKKDTLAYLLQYIEKIEEKTSKEDTYSRDVLLRYDLGRY